MKKILLSLITIFTVNAAASAQAENYQKFKVDALIGYALPSSGTGGGVTLSIEPKYNLTDNIAVGLQYGGSFFASGGSEISLNLSEHYLLTGEYYLGERKARPFLGLGAGLYEVGNLGTATNSTGQGTVTGEVGTKFGFAPRVGLQINHFRLALEYNIVANNNFLGIKIGSTFGGGAFE
jgi:opacity protein-like surface antigen